MHWAPFTRRGWSPTQPRSIFKTRSNRHECRASVPSDSGPPAHRASEMRHIPILAREIVVAALLSLFLAGCASLSSATSRTRGSAEAGAVATAIQDGLTIRWVRDPADTRQWAVELEGLSSEAVRALASVSWSDAQWMKLLSVYVEPMSSAAANDLPPVQGRYETLKDRIRFEPQFPVQPGVPYRVEVHQEALPGAPPEKSRVTAAWFTLPTPARIPKTVVQRVYPTSTQLPENLLKFYIQFSGPMSRGGIYEHIHLLDGAGKVVELPFLELDEELWNPEMTRLTLFIDPGRVKRGVRPLEEIGPSMQADGRYTLVIDKDWRDGDGAPLKAAYRRTFEVGPPDRDPPAPAAWRISIPKARTRQPLVIRFAEPMDNALARRLIWVTDTGRRKLSGNVVLADLEREWSFVPDTDWPVGRYEIVADTLLEDLAGNSLEKPFEVDVFEQVDERLSKKTVTLPFEIRSR